MRYLKKVGEEFLTGKWIFLILLLFPYGWLLNQSLMNKAIYLNLSINKWDFMIEFLSDPFLIIYILLPFWLLLSSRSIMTEWDYTLLIRLKNHSNWIIHTIKSAIPVLTVLMSLWVIIGFLIAISLPFESAWSSHSKVDIESNFIVFKLHQYIPLPSVAFITQLFIYSFFLITIHILLATLYLFFPHTICIMVVSIFVYCMTIISFKIATDIIWLQIPNYMLAFYSYQNFESVLPNLLIFTALILISFIVVKMVKKPKYRMKKDESL